MQLLKIKSSGFRNLQPQTLTFSPGVNLLLGANGQGKTNFLEMINFLMTLKSFRGAKRDQMTRWEDKGFQMEGAFLREGVEKDFWLQSSLESRVVKVNGNRIKDLLEYFCDVKAVCFSPEDHGILHGSPKERRRFIDRVVFQTNPQHLFWVKKYNRILKQRNALLKKWQIFGGKKPEELAVWTHQMLSHAAQLTQSRLQFLEKFNQIIPEEYAKISGRDEEEGVLKGAIQIVPQGRGKSSYFLDIHSEYSFENILQKYQDQEGQNASLERERGASQWGPHLDDFVLSYGDLKAEPFASMGQKKTFLLALRLSELRMVGDHFGEPPILLLDDISAELDAKRLKTLVHYLSEGIRRGGAPMQIFITTVSTTFDLLKPLGELHIFRVANGRLEKE